MDLRLAFFASHNGSAMQAVHHAIAEKKLRAEIILIASNNIKAPAFEFARAHNIPTLLTTDQALLVQKLRAAPPDLIMLSGYMRKIPPDLIAAISAPIINTHPALLPKFGGKGMFGLHVHRAVLAKGENISGATLHLVNENYDEGKIIAQSRVNVLDDDTPESLAARVKNAEAALMIKTLTAIAESKLPPKPAISEIAAKHNLC